MKRVISLVLAALLCMSFLMGCNSDSLAQAETSQDVVDYLKKQGMSIVYELPYSDEDQMNNLNQYDCTSRTDFSDSAIEETYDKNEPLSGTVELFKDADAAVKRADFIKAYQRPYDFGYLILKDNILLGINTFAPVEIVEKYANALGAEIYSEPNIYHKTPRTVSIGNNLFNESPEECLRIINQYLTYMIPLEDLIKNEEESFYKGELLYTSSVPIMTSSYLTFITDASRNHTKSILLDIETSDGSNTEMVIAYLAAIFFSVDPQMSEDLYGVIIDELGEGTLSSSHTALSIHNGIAYFAYLDGEGMHFMVKPDGYF